MAHRKHAPTHRVGAFAIIFDDVERVLVSRRTDSGWFNLPGGGVESDESVTEGLIREVREETGLEVELGRLVGIYSKPQKHEIVLTFRARVTGGTLVPSDEADYHTWITPSELAMVKLLPKHRERIEDALLNQLDTIIKDQREPSLLASDVEQIGGM
jgi:ADP-ribose pyrophosphatase YjhB (NUDIX family)